MEKKNSFESEEDNEESDETAITPLSNDDLELLSSISKILNQVIEQNKALKQMSKKIKEQSTMVFSARIPSKISLYDYLYRIKYYSEMANSTLILSMIYIDRICQTTNLILTPNNIHRVLFGSIICALKYNEDIIFNNNYYAQIAGVNLKELNTIEHFFIELIEFNFYVDKNQFNQYENYLKIINKKI